MTTTVEDRFEIAKVLLDTCWGCTYWSRDEQAFAIAEGWGLNVFADDERKVDRISGWNLLPDEGVPLLSHEEALAYVFKRAQEGSPLHARALLLHSASVLKYGDA